MYSFIDNPYLTESALADITKLLEGSDKEYEAFFKKALAKFGVKSPDDLKGKKQKEFFDYVEKNYKAINEEAKPTHYIDPRTGIKQSLSTKAAGIRAQIQAIQKKYPVNPTTGTHKPYSDADKTRIEALRKQLKQYNESVDLTEEVMIAALAKDLKKGSLYKVINGSKVMQGVYTGKNDKEEHTFKTVSGNVSFPENLINKRVYKNNDKK